MSNIILQIERSSGGTLAPSDNVIFDTIVHLSGDISYNLATGIITFNGSGLPDITPELETVNSAETILEMQAAIEDPLLGLDLEIYNMLSQQAKEDVLQFMIDNRPVLGYFSVSSVQESLDYLATHTVDPENIWVQSGSLDGDGSLANPLLTWLKLDAIPTESFRVYF